jgi:hypothetical protein
MTQKTLDAKLERMQANPTAREFILADAKDADMAHGIAAPGIEHQNQGDGDRIRTLQSYRELIRENTRQGYIDIMLMSASTSEVLTIEERLFDASPVTPAIRANDTTDIWLARGSSYGGQPSIPFRSASLDMAMFGTAAARADDRVAGTDLGLYSITFNNDAEADQLTLEAYARFRKEAAAKGFRYFLEFFDPNAPLSRVEDVGAYMNDMIVRTLAGVAGDERPLFLKVAYHGAAAMEELASYDSGLVVGIMGGSSGTTFDAFHQLWEARKHGARAALYGRMINNAEDQRSFIRQLRALADGQTTPDDAVRTYHADLERNGIRPLRTLENDLRATISFGS